MPQKPSRKSFITRANRGHVRVVGIEPRCCGNGSSGLPSPISHTWASVLRCRMFCGPSFDNEALIAYLWEALKATELNVDLNRESVRAIFKTQYGRTWNIYIARFQSKSQFLRYAGRYIRRPPIAEHRFVSITDQEVQFLTKDLKQKRVVTTRYSLLEFVAILTEHVPDHYRHGIRYFGLLAPRSKALTSAALFTLLGQEKRRRPQRLSWRNSLRRYFGIDPLRDSRGEVMHWVSRRKSVAQ